MKSAAISIAVAIALVVAFRWARSCYIGWRDRRDRLVPLAGQWDLIMPYEPSARQRRL